MKNNNRPSLMSRHYKTPRSKVARSAYVCFVISRLILGDPGADKRGRGKYGTKKSKERREEPLGTSFPACLDFPSPPLSAHGSPRMFRASTMSAPLLIRAGFMHVLRVVCCTAPRLLNSHPPRRDLSPVRRRCRV